MTFHLNENQHLKFEIDLPEYELDRIIRKLRVEIILTYENN